MTRKTVIVVCARGCEYRDPIGVFMTPKAADKFIKDVQEFVAKCPPVNWDGEEWEKQQARAVKYLKQRPWGSTAHRAEDFTKDRVLVRWVE